MIKFTNLKFLAMKMHFLLLFCIGSFLSGNLAAQKSNPFKFVSPKPGSTIVSPSTNIILRHAEFIDMASLSSNLVNVEGSKSGDHRGNLILSDDGRTIVFNPDVPFDLDEVVNINISEGIRTQTGKIIAEFTFQYITAKSKPKQVYSGILDETLGSSDQRNSSRVNQTEELLPPPPITINSINNPSDGYIFMATWDRTKTGAEYGNFIFVLDKSGVIVDSVRVNGAPFDFRVQPNGLLTYAKGDFASFVPQAGEELKHMVLDQELNPIDSFQMKNGYPTDFHEFKMLPNGHVMLMSYYSVEYDMSTIVEGGQTDAELVLNIIQEQDIDKNVVFEWSNIDHIPITDSDLDLTKSRINYSTLNAFDIDTDGNILVSFRNHSEIAKISKETGELLWRMGGRQNQFTYVGEHEENAVGIDKGEEIGSPYYHARQHNIQRNSNGNITLFDNGEFHSPQYSRGVEYSIDEENKVATLVSEWRYPDGNIFCATAGNAELLDNGGWFIGFGVPNANAPNVTRNAIEVHPDGSMALELSLPNSVLAYRVNKMPWKETVDTQTFIHYEVTEGGDYSYNNSSITTGVELTYNSITAYDYNESIITRVPYGPIWPKFEDTMTAVSPVSITYDVFSIFEQNTEIRVDLTVYPEIVDPENTYFYHRETIGEGVFKRLTTTYDAEENKLIATITDIGELIFGVPEYITAIEKETNFNNKLAQNYPNPFSSVTRIPYVIDNPGSVRISIHNSQGQEVMSLVNKFQRAGKYTASVNASKLPRGIYFYSLLVGNELMNRRKMYLIR